MVQVQERHPCLIVNKSHKEIIMKKDQYISLLESKIAQLENEDLLGLNTSDKLRIQLEEILDCNIHISQMDLILEYIYDFLKYKEIEK
jgi:hypothetical protein